jgi:hypothetical protein
MHTRTESMYRFFDEERYADEFVNGNVFVSTFKRCRAYENKYQGDIGEGSLTYNGGRFVGNSDSFEFKKILSNMPGIKIEGSNITFDNNTQVTRVHDAFVLCLTTKFQPGEFNIDFGRFCVEIINPKSLFSGLNSAIRHKYRVSGQVFDHCVYSTRSYFGSQNSPGNIYLLKPQSYSYQYEYRGVWIPETLDNIEAQVFKIGKSRRIFRRCF